MKIGCLVMLGLALTISSCSLFTSRPLQKDFSERAVSYFLPTGLVRVKVDTKATGTTEITVNEVIVPDVSQRYYIALNNDALSKDNFTIQTDNGLLKQVQVKIKALR
jgi:hypothetical protein